MATITISGPRAPIGQYPVYTNNKTFNFSQRPPRHTMVPAIPHDRVIPAPEWDWQSGEIAFLKQEADFDPADRPLVDSGYLHAKATGHPVIILHRAATHAIVTLVSAYSSGDFNNYLPPWEQYWHSSKNPRDFRSFAGSERYDATWPYLQLKTGSMPKPRASWTYTQSAWVVPLSTITFFTKAGRDVLQMTEESLADLKGHFKKHCKVLKDCLEDPRLKHKNPDSQAINKTAATTTTITATATATVPIKLAQAPQAVKPAQAPAKPLNMAWSSVASSSPKTGPKPSQGPFATSDLSAKLKAHQINKCSWRK